MRRFRFHLGTLLMLVLVLGVGFAALRESNETWDCIIFSATLGVLSISTLFAVHRTGQRRAFWLGFALIGSAYLAFCLVPSIEPRLITTRALAYLDSKVPDRAIVQGVFGWSTSSSKPTQNNQSVNSTAIAFSPQGNLVTSGNRSVMGDWIVVGNLVGTASGSTMNFVSIGHSLLALIVALLGGQLSGFFYRKNRDPVSGSVNPLGSHSTGAKD